MAVIKKLTPKITTPKPDPDKIGAKEVEVAAEKAETPEVAENLVEVGREGEEKKVVSKKVCFFHKNKAEPAYWDAAGLRKFLNDRGRIYPRTRMATCAKHQRRLSREIKRARFLALLPYSSRV